MKFKEFLKANIAYIIACVNTLGIIGFLFAPLLTYETKYYVGEEKVKEYFSTNIITLFNSSITRTWIPIVIIVLIGIMVISLCLIIILRKIAKLHDAFITVNLITISVLAAYLLMTKELFSYFAGEYGLIENFNGANVGWGIGVIIFLAAIIFFSLISISSFSKQSIKGISEDAMLIAAAFVLNYIKIPIGSTGGSINFQMLPLMIIALRRGPLTGFICSGVIYGLITCITDGYGFATYPFDYLIGFGSAAVLGFFRPLIFPKNDAKTKYLWPEIFILIAGIASTLVRFIGSTSSSVIIYGLDLVAGMAYNAIYIPVSGAASIVILMFLYPALVQINRRFPAK